MRRVLAFVACAALIAIPVAAKAGTCSSLMSPAVGFGTSLLAGSNNNNIVQLITLTCSGGTAYTLALGKGLHSDSGVGFAKRRQLASGANTMPYDFYQDAGHTTTWGDGTNVGATQAGTGSGAAQNFGLYGQLNVPAGAVPGTYTDTVVVTLSF